MANRVDFYNSSNQIVSKLSGGRPHFPARERITVLESYEYTLSQGENPYTLALQHYNDDSLYWIISEHNEPRDPMAWEAGEIIHIPSVIVDNSLKQLQSY